MEKKIANRRNDRSSSNLAEKIEQNNLLKLANNLHYDMTRQELDRVRHSRLYKDLITENIRKKDVRLFLMTQTGILALSIFNKGKTLVEKIKEAPNMTFYYGVSRVELGQNVEGFQSALEGYIP